MFHAGNGSVEILADAAGKRTIPSVVAFTDNGTILVGHAAKVWAQPRAWQCLLRRTHLAVRAAVPVTTASVCTPEGGGVARRRRAPPACLAPASHTRWG